jgi:hypothetical protein
MESDIYYTTTVLDPRIKGDLVLKELSDGDAGKDVVGTIRLLLYQKYHPMQLSRQARPLKDLRRQLGVVR